MVNNPREIVREILDYLGVRGIVAGGAIRDIVMERMPKDYDVFIPQEQHYRILTTTKGIFDKKPEPVRRPDIALYEGHFEVYNTTLRGESVQLIYAEAFNPYTGSIYSSNRKVITSDEIVAGFPFSINMMYVDHHNKIRITKAAHKALKERRLLYSCEQHRGGAHDGPPAPYVCRYLLKRVFYLAKKLDFCIPMRTIEDIYFFNTHDDELSEREWVEEAINA